MVPSTTGETWPPHSQRPAANPSTSPAPPPDCPLHAPLRFAVFLVFILSLPTAFAQTPALWSPILNPSPETGVPHLSLNRHLLTQMADAEQRIIATAASLRSTTQLKTWQADTRRQFLEALGGFPERTPLNPKIVGNIQRESYRVEKILFESRPFHFVTAALFLPDEKKFPRPWPGILIPCGHSANGKALDAYQRGAVIAAHNGMAALLYDPIDQGERLQQLANSGKTRFSNVGGHNKIGVSAQPLGWNTATFRIWDGMRALDYLASRPEIDPRRLGCMGNSGGGTLTSYLMALDDRIAAAAPSCYLTTLLQVCANIGPQDAEQNIFGQLAFGMDHAEFLYLRAPTPILACAAQKDFFPIAGNRQAVARARGVLSRLGFGERVNSVENDGPHGWAEPLRVAGNQWMSRWLRGVTEITLPPATETGLKEADLRVTEHGQVMLLPSARSVYDLMRDELARLAKSRPAPTPAGLQSAVRRRAGIRPLVIIPKPVIAAHGDSRQPWGTHRRLTFETAPGLLLPAWLLLPTTPTGTPVLLAHGLGKSAATNEALALVQSGRPVLALDLSGFGETQGARQNFYGSDARDEPDAIIAYLLGRSLTGLRAEDLLVAARWLAENQRASAVELHAVSWARTPALHAAVAEPDLFQSVVLDSPTPSWHDVVIQGDRHRFSDVIHGALRDYDLPDLATAARAVSSRR